jgi:hypothetical protein
LARCPEPRLFGGRDGGLWEWPDSSCHSLVGSFKIEFFFFFSHANGFCWKALFHYPRDREADRCVTFLARVWVIERSWHFLMLLYCMNGRPCSGRRPSCTYNMRCMCQLRTTIWSHHSSCKRLGRLSKVCQRYTEQRNWPRIITWLYS